MKERVFVTGGAGYIGSHTCLELLQARYDVTVYDNFANSNPEALRRVEKLSGKKIRVIQGDLRDKNALKQAIQGSAAESVIHFAGLKAVGESVNLPLDYYDTNVVGTLRLLESMEDLGLRSLVFSSSATVYGNPQKLPLEETHPLSATNPYGRTKLVIEDMLRDAYASNGAWKFGILRYFNPVGAHPSGLIGEDPKGPPNNLMPYVSQVAVGKREQLHVWGNDYPTIDGTGVRDYIHVVDLALGHLSALQYLGRCNAGVCEGINLGTGKGFSVLELVSAFEHASGKNIPKKIEARRSGDVAAVYGDCAKANSLLGWNAKLDLQAMCADAWRWQSANPNGYTTA
ncbi:MAG: UDP-glucose 4-epimerase GalE [Rhodoferax sp.]